MMKDLLEAYFGKYYRSTKRVSVISKVDSGLLSFSDSKACAQCVKWNPQMEKDCERVVLLCDFGNHKVETIELEAFIDMYANLKAITSGKKCDILLSDDEKIVFCDMPCTQAKYIDRFTMADGTEKIGKRNTVRIQIENSISLLSGVPELAEAISTKQSKIALFAYRVKPEKTKEAFDSRVSASMKVLDSLKRNLSKTPMYSSMSNGFLFTEIQYPDVYIW